MIHITYLKHTRARYVAISKINTALSTIASGSDCVAEVRGDIGSMGIRLNHTNSATAGLDIQFNSKLKNCLL